MVEQRQRLPEGAQQEVVANPGGPRRRVGFLSSHPIQYTAPFYAYLNRSSDIEPIVFYLTDYSCRGAVDRQFGTQVVWDVDLLDGYEHHFVGKHWRTAHFYGFFSLRTPAIAGAIRNAKLDALVLHGHQYAANLIALAGARTAGVPVFYKAETHLALPRSKLKAALRPAMLKPLFSQMSGFLAIGTRNAEFYRALGVKDERIFHYPYAVDNARFMAQSREASEGRAERRRALGFNPDRPVILFASKLMERKNPDHLLEACAALVAEGRAPQLLIAGTGEMESNLRARAAEVPGLTTVFAGFVNQSALPGMFAASDIFVLPSRDEPWGLIVNEAMCAGLPVVASREIGCAADLIRDGENGFTFDAGDVPALTDALRRMLDDPQLRRRMGERSIKLISRWSFEEDRQGLTKALDSVSHRTKRT